eukprot:3620873-Pleurochrysis_carterae.AAC.1
MCRGVVWLVSEWRPPGLAPMLARGAMTRAHNVGKHCGWAELRVFGIPEAVYGLPHDSGVIIHYEESYLGLGKPA